MTDIYTAPSADLTADVNTSEFGSVERGIAGDYEMSFGGVFSEAADLLKGSKTPILLSFLLLFACSMGLGIVSGILGAILGAMGLGPVSAIIMQVLIILVTTPLSAGMFIVAIKLAAKHKTSPTSIFNYYSRMMPLFLGMLLLYLMIIIGYILLIIPGIYLSIAYIYALPLIAEKGMSPWQALETSRKTVTHRWFLVFGLLIVMTIINMIAMIPLGIGLIWTLPLTMLVMGVMYKVMFGIEAATLTSE